MPPTTPVVALTVPNAGLLLVHVPPPVELPKVIVAFTLTVAGPVIVAGDELTVTTVLTLQPALRVYVMEDVPVATPVTRPEDALIVAIEVVPLLQVPPLVESLNAVVNPVHTTAVPVIAGTAVTVIVVIRMHPVLSIYVMMAVPVLMPAAIPVDEPMVAIPLLLLVQIPPETELFKVVVEPIHAIVAPVITGGREFTVTIIVLLHTGPRE